MSRLVDTTVTGAPASGRATAAGHRPRPGAWVAPLRMLGWPVGLMLALASLGLLALFGYGLVGLVAILALAVSIPLMQWLPQRLPPLNHLRTRNLNQVEVETRLLAGYGLLYPLLLIPVVIGARALPASLVPGVSSPLFSPLYVLLGKVVLLGVPAVLLAGRMGQLGRQLGLRRVNSTWRWLGPVVPFALLMLALGTLGVNGKAPLSLLPYLLALPLAVVSVGFPEESFYRVLLQTRLELLLGSRSGIAVASLLYGLMQIPVRFAFVWSTVEPNLGRAVLLSVATAIGYQAVLGVLYGYMWMRYRNAWLNMASHSALEAVGLAALIAA